MAAINAVLSLRGDQPLVLSREQAYIGVLIDDLVTKGTDNEPYRMFTSRAEYRLLLREDNADLRLTEIGHTIGVVASGSYQRVESKKEAVTDLATFLEHTYALPSAQTNALLESFQSAQLRNQASLAQLLRRPEISMNQLRQLRPDIPNYRADVDAQVEIRIKYQGYVNRQQEIVERFQKMEHARLPENTDYSRISGLSREVCEKLTQIKPHSLGQAARIPGITPAAISLLSFYIKTKTA
jgi:tRNA uridine 5-carboxymethylaminomethyl modification enzyme